MKYLHILERKLVNEKKLFNKKRSSCRELGISPNQLKHQSSDRYKGKKPPRKKFGGTTLYGPVAALKNWFNSDLSLENKSAKSDKKLKVVK